MPRYKHKSKFNDVSLHKNEQDLEETLEIVAHFYIRGYSQVSISDEVKKAKGIRPTQPTIHKYIKKLKERWREDERLEREEYVRTTLLKIDAMEEEAWKAWEASKNDEVSKTEERAVPRALKEAVETASKKEVEGRKKRAPEPAEAKLETIKQVIRTTGRLPHAAYLNIVAVCIQMRRELLGLDAPKEVKVEGKVGGKVRMDWTVRSKALPALEEVEAEIERVKALNAIPTADVVLPGEE